jgi:ABC-type branched-subunit amino acid transport system ATPase component
VIREQNEGVTVFLVEQNANRGARCLSAELGAADRGYVLENGRSMVLQRSTAGRPRRHRRPASRPAP